MRKRFALRGTITVVLAMCCSLAAAQTPDRRIAITIDDLPWQHIGRTTDADLQVRHAQLIEQVKQAKAPVVGFVNEDRLEVGGVVQPARQAMLHDWLDAGAELGNHTYGHVNLNVAGVAAFEDAILKGERQLRPLLAERGTQPHWFRQPYLRAGLTQADKAEVHDFLSKHGYRIAPVTATSEEPVWALAYQNVLDGKAPTTDREAMLRRLREGYIPYMLNKIDYYERQSQKLLGYALPQVWLVHANALNATCYAELVAAVRRRGYTTITLEEAMRDPAYARPDLYQDNFGPSWLHRWAMAEKKPKDFYAGEPMLPKWVRDLAEAGSK